ncbi:hypothetical protein Cgig2_013882 [Carnegiea gigantea]|uniref:Endonuclease/exonuclease/phosphatase domain-containing protein n=1 Tax=Carnegiea gigantea TaxID=171969 RepID=A0A9Q1JJF9_9CARY|nr:hypothetical protein Cgig2_013882 [Carnegiea gigantea]
MPKKTGIRQEWRRVVRDTAPFSHTARTDAAQSPTKAAKMQHEQTVTVTIQPEHPVNDNVQDVQPAQPHQNMDSSPSASANTQSPDRASKIDQSDADGFTIVRRKQSSRPNTRSQMLTHPMRSIVRTVHWSVRPRGLLPMYSIASWNIQGLNWPPKQEEVKIFLHAKHIGLICLLETKVKQPNVDKIAANTFPGWKWHHNFDKNPKGRIWLAWDPKVFTVSILHTTEQILHTHVTDQHTHKQFHATFIYGFNHMAQRHPLWADLLTIAHRTTTAWCIIGDFNTILRPEDRIGGDPVEDFELQELQNCLDSCELTELPSTGAYFTWINKTIWSRIDRALVKGLWHDTFDYTNAHFGASGISDHSPILLQFLQTSKPKHMFQYCDMWATHYSFHHLISEALTCMHGPDPIQRLISFMDCIRPLLRRLSRNKYRDLWAQQTQARQHLTNVQEVLALGPQNQTLLAQAQDLRTKYLDITASSLSLMRQQTKIEWIGYGDSGSRLFFTRVNQCKLASYIYTLHTSQGELVEGFDDVGKHMSLFYRQLLRTQAKHRQRIDHHIILAGPVLSHGQQIDLCKSFSDKEIKAAFFSIPNHKSPGPDGFSSGFFKHTWDQIGPLVCNAAHHFFRIGRLPRRLGEMKLVVLPKIAAPKSASDFRPISCCNVLYKGISKLLCTRLKQVLLHLIHPSQAAFVPGENSLQHPNLSGFGTGIPAAAFIPTMPP